jgi:hypothetical protein
LRSKDSGPGNAVGLIAIFNPAPKAGVFTPRTPTSALTADFVGEGYDSPLTQQYSLDVEYEFAPRTMLEVGFVGSRGNRLSMTRNINEPLLASPSSPVNGITTNTVANAGQRVPILGFAPNGLVSIETLGASMYNSMQVIVKRQFGHGIQFQGAYTYILVPLRSGTLLKSMAASTRAIAPITYRIKKAGSRIGRNRENHQERESACKSLILSVVSAEGIQPALKAKFNKIESNGRRF